MPATPHPCLPVSRRCELPRSGGAPCRGPRYCFVIHIHAHNCRPVSPGVVDCKERRGAVQLGRYPASHPFAQLQGSDNIIAFTTQRYLHQPLIIR